MIRSYATYIYYESENLAFEMLEINMSIYITNKSIPLCDMELRQVSRKRNIKNSKINVFLYEPLVMLHCKTELKRSSYSKVFTKKA